jgi:NADH-quinone oxidoreductase subunit N
MIPAVQIANFHRLLPEIILCTFGILIMLIDPFVSAAGKKAMAWLAIIGAVLALLSVEVVARDPGPAYSNLISSDQFSVFLHITVIVAAILAMLGSMSYLEQEDLQRGEYYALVLFATAGMGIMVGANELVTSFVGLEMSSISTYILAGFRRHTEKSNEASLKYFMLGSFATAFFLYGIAMVYGATGTTKIDGIQAYLAAQSTTSSLAILGLALIFVGLGFKVVAAPFQIYGPDVYEGAPTPVTALLASGPKTATFAIMVRIFVVAFGSTSNLWFWAVFISAVLTMFIGNLAALVQTNVKRMLAYSSIAHAGYVLVALAASSVIGVAAVLFYLGAYVLMKVGAFLVVAHLGQKGEKRLEIRDYAGLGQTQPLLAATFSLFLFSLLGLPATGGFLGKFFAFQAALDVKDPRFTWLVVIAAINSVIGAYYYLRVIIVMYFSAPSKDYTPTAVAPALSFALAIAAIGTVYLGVLPARALALAKSAADSLALR